MRQKRTIKAGTVIALAAAGSLCVVPLARADFTPITIPAGKVLTKNLRELLLTDQLRVQFSSTGAGSATAVDGIELKGRWHQIGQRGIRVRRAPAKPVRREVDIKLSKQGRQLISSQKSGRIRVIIRGDSGRQIKLVVTLPAK